MAKNYNKKKFNFLKIILISLISIFIFLYGFFSSNKIILSLSLIIASFAFYNNNLIEKIFFLIIYFFLTTLILILHSLYLRSVGAIGIIFLVIYGIFQVPIFFLINYLISKFKDREIEK